MARKSGDAVVARNCRSTGTVHVAGSGSAGAGIWNQGQSDRVRSAVHYLRSHSAAEYSLRGRQVRDRKARVIVLKM